VRGKDRTEKKHSWLGFCNTWVRVPGGENLSQQQQKEIYGHEGLKKFPLKGRISSTEKKCGHLKEKKNHRKGNSSNPKKGE